MRKPRVHSNGILITINITVGPKDVTFFFLLRVGRAANLFTHQYRKQIASPIPTTILIIAFRDIAQPSTPGPKCFLIFEKYFTVLPEKMRATFAPSPNRG